MSEKRAFVYISFYFPPLGGAEPRHNLSFIKRLHSRGFLPTIITAPEKYPYAKDEYLKRLIPEGIDIRRCRWPYQRERYTRFARRHLKIPENPFAFNNWKTLYSAAKEAVNEKDIEFIYSVHGMGAAHLAAMELKRKTGLPWVAEFRDPWIHNVIAWNYMKDNSWGWWYNLELKRTRRLTSEIIENADLVVVESTMHRDFLISDFNVEEEKVVPLGMGYEEDYFKDVSISPPGSVKRPLIGFVGSVYYGYDHVVRNLIHALKELEREGFDFTLMSVGDSSSVFSKYAKEEKIKNYLPVSRVDYAKALGFMGQLDFGIILGPENYRLIVNSKLWEYLKFNLSVLAIVPADSMAAEIIDKGKCGYILPYETGPMYQALKKVMIEHKNNEIRRPDPNYIKTYSAEKMVDELAKRIQCLL